MRVLVFPTKITCAYPTTCKVWPRIELVFVRLICSLLSWQIRRLYAHVGCLLSSYTSANLLSYLYPTTMPKEISVYWLLAKVA